MSFLQNVAAIQIDELCSLLSPGGADDTSAPCFALYYVGGVARTAYRPDDGQPPPLISPYLHDDKRTMARCMSLRASPWLDCDSDKPNVAALSMRELRRELDYFCFIGAPAFCLELLSLDRFSRVFLLDEASINTVYIGAMVC